VGVSFRVDLVDFLSPSWTIRAPDFSASEVSFSSRVLWRSVMIAVYGTVRQKLS
jgi:hypothetical protein